VALADVGDPHVSESTATQAASDRSARILAGSRSRRIWSETHIEGAVAHDEQERRRNVDEHDPRIELHETPSLCTSVATSRIPPEK
jgi:hypothetical protein